jgi:hypothetical protein
MAELDFFRGFRSGVEPPTEAARRRAAAAWESIAAAPVPRANVLRYAALGFAALAVATAAALFLSAPWKDSPGFLDRAEAALTGDPSTVLHARWQVTVTSTDPACTVSYPPNEIWIDQRPPHRYRAFLSHIPPEPSDLDPQAFICGKGGVAAEVGGTLEPECPSPTQSVCTHRTIWFEPPNTLSESPLHFGHPADQASDLVAAIAAGRAHDEGETQLDGRTVHRIRMDPDPQAECPYTSCPSEPVYAFVDADTFVPVETQGHGGFFPPGGDVIWFRAVMRFQTYEYLPRTPANLALADIRAQHPGAVER